jgi:glutamate synthase (NADPH/NADH) small chain
VTNFEILPAPPLHENKMLTWPNWPLKLRTSSSHEEGAERDFAVMTTRFSGAQGIRGKASLRACRRQAQNNSRQRIRDRGRTCAAGDGLRASGARGHDQGTQSCARSARQYRASTDDYRTSIDKVFAAGDMRRGQSLVVWAIREGRQAAHAVDAYLMGSSLLPR